MRIWPWQHHEPTTRPEGAQEAPEESSGLQEPPEEPTTEQVLDAGPALDWGGDPSRITG